MSSSNAVSVTYVDESTYGETPDPAGAITIETTRFISESLSGTPLTTESAAIRTDRMSGGQVITGLEVGGDLNFELARDGFTDDFFELGMMNTWAAATGDVSSVSFTLDGGDPQRGDLAGTGVGTGIVVGDILKVTDGSTNYIFQVITVTDADNLVVACQRDQVNFTGATSRRPAYLDIGANQASVTLAKAYEDVLDGGGPNEHSQTYAGAIVSGFNINAAFGQIVTGAFTVAANGYDQETPSFQQQVVNNGGTVNSAATTQPLNASVDAPVVTTDGTATNFCLESFTLTLDNGLTPQNCIGKAAPRRYELGTAAISIETQIYLGEDSYESFMPGKLTQTPISFTFVTINSDGGYAFNLPAVQLSFPDPEAAGANQATFINASGTAKVGANGESALRIYQL